MRRLWIPATYIWWHKLGRNDENRDCRSRLRLLRNAPGKAGLRANRGIDASPWGTSKSPGQVGFEIASLRLRSPLRQGYGGQAGQAALSAMAKFNGSFGCAQDDSGRERLYDAA
jgi:hypothetical protein